MNLRSMTHTESVAQHTTYYTVITDWGGLGDGAGVEESNGREA